MKSHSNLILILTSLSFLALAGCNSNDVAAANGSAGGVDSGALTNGGSATPTPVQVFLNSCKEILAANPGSADGNYTINLGSTGTTTQVFCDMTTEGGGWTVILDGANADRAALNKFFDNTDENNLPDSAIVRNADKGIFWEANQYFVAKNMPQSSDIRVIFNLSYNDPTYGSDCDAILGLGSPNGYSANDSTSFTAFAEKYDSSSYVKAILNDQEFSENQSVQVNATASYPFPFVNGSRVWAGNPYAPGQSTGHTCSTFFFKRIMVR